ncbi:hypothetical protein DKX38_000766 [Salix brachista]|uniref:Uncharacterized protein n=1 Tax=Salix brachista TaxID=2182728 RepID=A0A5N5P1U0_9ROSI|nr:hypothetical protein DKX38_000766 [Salix brachista]
MGKRRGGGGSKKPPPNTLTASNKSFVVNTKSGNHNPKSLLKLEHLQNLASFVVNTKSGNHNPKSLLKLEHLQNLASWASEEASTPSLAAFFGRQFASSAEVLGVPLDPYALFQCQRLVSNIIKLQNLQVLSFLTNNSGEAKQLQLASFVPALVEFYVPSVLQEEDSLAPQTLPDIHPIRFPLLQLCILLQFLTCPQLALEFMPLHEPLKLRTQSITFHALPSASVTVNTIVFTITAF